MSHVTTLQELEAEMYALVCWRAEWITWAQQIIERTNRTFDREAKPLGRKINQLRATETSAPKRHREPHFDGLDDDDIAHYKQLLKQKG